MSNPEVLKNYRNSFDWFDYGIVEGQEVESEIPTKGQAFVDYVRYQLNEAVDEMEKKERAKTPVVEEPVVEEKPVRYYLAYGSNLILWVIDGQPLRK